MKIVTANNGYIVDNEALIFRGEFVYKNLEEVFDSHNNWLHIESICRQFISIFYSAVRLYAETTGEITLLKNIRYKLRMFSILRSDYII